MDEDWENVSVDYLVTDNLGNEYNVLHNASFGNSEYVQMERFSSTLFPEKATSIRIRPRVNIFKKKNENEFELAKEPYMLDPINVNFR